MLPLEKRINTKKDLKEWLEYECAKYPCSRLSYWLGMGEFAILRRHQVLLRKTEYYRNTNQRLRHVISLVKLRKLQMKHALHIPLNCCGKGLQIMHLGPVLMNNCVTVGTDCTIHMNVALVAGGTTHGVPRLGDRVIVGYGAVVLGDINISNGVAIGANAVVNKDCWEENVAIAGVPAKVISHNGSGNWGKGAR